MSGEYAQGSVIVCEDCKMPIYALERGLGPMDHGGRAASAFRPLMSEDMAWLSRASYVPYPWRQLVSEWWASASSYKVRHAPRPKSGDATICPNCGGIWARFAERDESSVHDRGYVIDLFDIPPSPGRRRIHIAAMQADDTGLTVHEEQA